MQLFADLLHRVMGGDEQFPGMCKFLLIDVIADFDSLRIKTSAQILSPGR